MALRAVPFRAPGNSAGVDAARACRTALPSIASKTTCRNSYPDTVNVNVGLCSTASVSSCRLCDPPGFLERRAIPWGFSNVNGHIMEPRQALRMRMRPIFAIVCCVRSNPKQLTWKDTSLYPHSHAITGRHSHSPGA